MLVSGWVVTHILQLVEQLAGDVVVHIPVLSRKLGQGLAQVQGVDASGLKTTADGGGIILLHQPFQESGELLNKKYKKVNIGGYRYRYCYPTIQYSRVRYRTGTVLVQKGNIA
jgi:hypothetical protein